MVERGAGEPWLAALALPQLLARWYAGRAVYRRFTRAAAEAPPGGGAEGAQIAACGDLWTENKGDLSPDDPRTNRAVIEICIRKLRAISSKINHDSLT